MGPVEPVSFRPGFQGAGDGIRTHECQLGRLMPYRLATPASVKQVEVGFNLGALLYQKMVWCGISKTTADMQGRLRTLG
jgi:hypothetical protein